jgi:hypothetical protein
MPASGDDRRVSSILAVLSRRPQSKRVVAPASADAATSNAGWPDARGGSLSGGCEACPWRGIRQGRVQIPHCKPAVADAGAVGLAARRCVPRDDPRSSLMPRHRGPGEDPGCGSPIPLAFRLSLRLERFSRGVRACLALTLALCLTRSAHAPSRFRASVLKGEMNPVAPA